MTTEQTTNAGKALRKRFLIFFLIFGFILAITILTATTPFSELSVKTMVLDEAPDFAIIKDVSSKNTSVDYKIIFTFRDFEDSLNISGSDLEFADRAAIQKDLKAGDTVEVVYHEQFLYICQVAKDGKDYMDPVSAFKNGEATDAFVLWVCIIGAATCLVGFFLARSGVRYAGWWCMGVILISIVILFFSFGVKFADAREYPEFSKEAAN